MTMTDKPIRAILPTSFSHIKAYEQCPKQFYHAKHLNEFPFTESVHTLYGKEAHSAAEHFIAEDIALPKKFAFMQDMLDSLKAKHGNKFCEIKMGITRNFVPCSFFSKEVWIRGIIDLLIVDGDLAWVIDYKTSKNANYADKDQLELMSLLVFSHYPEVKRINGGLVFVKCNQLVKAKYKKIDKAELWSGWVARNNSMIKSYELDKWPTRPSGLCGAHCPVTSCIHNGANK